MTIEYSNMKQKEIHLLAILLCLFSSLPLLAYDVKVNGIYYSINELSKTATVTFGDDKYSGSINIPSSFTNNGVSYSVTALGLNAFYSCSTLENITIPNSVINIDPQCFMGCSSLLTITIPESVTSIGATCFSGCRSLSSITILGAIESLGIHCFANCESLKSIRIPSSVVGLGDYCFMECTSLENIEIPNSISKIPQYCFESCTSLKTIQLPISITELEEGCFFGCSSLENIKIPENVTDIGQRSFMNCTSLKVVLLPELLTNMGKNCFRGCSGLKKVFAEMSTVPFTEYDGYFIDSSCSSATLYVPSTMIDDYCTAAWWKNFGTIKPINKEITISSLGIATYCSDDDLDFTGVDGIKAYIASGYNNNTGNVLLTRVKEVPAGTGILLMGDGGTYEIPTTDVDYTYANLLVGTLEDTNLTSVVGYKNYILANGSSGVKFYLSENGTLAANKAYLKIQTSANSAAKILKFSIVGENGENDDNTTDVGNVNALESNKEKAIYNLQGQAVKNPSKGLYIINGKKIVK